MSLFQNFALPDALLLTANRLKSTPVEREGYICPALRQQSEALRLGLVLLLTLLFNNHAFNPCRKILNPRSAVAVNDISPSNGFIVRDMGAFIPGFVHRTPVFKDFITRKF